MGKKLAQAFEQAGFFSYALTTNTMLAYRPIYNCRNLFENLLLFLARVAPVLSAV